MMQILNPMEMYTSMQNKCVVSRAKNRQDTSIKDFSVGTLRGTSMVSFFFDADENSLRWRMGQELIMPVEENLVGSITQGLARAKSHKYAFLSDMVSTPLFFPASQTGCEFLEVSPSQPTMINNTDSIYQIHLHISPGSL